MLTLIMNLLLMSLTGVLRLADSVNRAIMIIIRDGKSISRLYFATSSELVELKKRLQDLNVSPERYKSFRKKSRTSAFPTRADTLHSQVRM